MLSDMVGRGAFHSHIMTRGGRIAKPPRTAQLDGVLRFPARPAMQAPEIQTALAVVLMESSFIDICIPQRYRHSLRSRCALRHRQGPTRGVTLYQDNHGSQPFTTERDRAHARRCTGQPPTCDLSVVSHTRDSRPERTRDRRRLAVRQVWAALGCRTAGGGHRVHRMDARPRAGPEVRH